MNRGDFLFRTFATRRKRRRGAIYMIVLATTMIVAVLGLSALWIVRIQRSTVSSVQENDRALLYARGGLDMAKYRVENDPSWRVKMSNGTWNTDQTIGDGHYRFTGSDPGDGDLNNSVYDTVMVTAIGKSGRAIQKLKATMNARQEGIRCLEPVLHAGNNVVFSGGTTTGYGVVSANNQVQTTNNAQVFTNAQAATSCTTSTGGQFLGTTSTAGTWPRQMPNTSTVFDYYTFNGTTININNLPAWDAALISNGNMENAQPAPWVGNGICSLSNNTSFFNSGTRSVYVSGRLGTTSGASQDVTNTLEKGETYYAEAYIRATVVNEKYRLVLRTNSTGDGIVDTPLSNFKNMNTNGFGSITGDPTVTTWNGELTQALLFVQSELLSNPYYIDDVVFRISGAPSGWKVFHRKLLSPSNNPFGASLNANGIYVLDCAGAKISIKDSRILGTLVLLNQDATNSKIHGSIQWVPAIVNSSPTVNNMPALLTNADLRIEFDSSLALGEAGKNFNANPSGTPYAGSTDSDKSDSYPSIIKGVVYTSGSFTFAVNPKFEGVVVSNGNITVNGNCTLQYEPLYYTTNAPPGFKGTLKHFFVPGSYKQAVD